MAIIFVISLLVLSITQRTGPRSVSAGSLDIRDVMPDVMMGAYKDYELVHLEEREEEDTVSIPGSKFRSCTTKGDALSCFRTSQNSSRSIADGISSFQVYITKRVDPKVPKTKECDDCDRFSPWVYQEEADAVKRDLGVLDEAKNDTTPRHISVRFVF
jgi:hypothetical protein